MLIIAIFYGVNEACKENRIVLKNRLGHSKILQYHCHSPKVDLGVLYLDFNAIRIIKVKDEGVNITKWDCLFKHGINMRFHSYIQVYSQNTFAPQCDQLRQWSFTKSAIGFTYDDRRPSGPKYRWSTF
ncbi:hypothetical protein AXX17_AT4G14990 [Arabidopsis thaliana]|uniref:Uncharacterized protein n=1 Tax=Arabidopsis thaliana TaxID=3702 RepID=A0A178UWI7_ARATH|nr:hypothetical protein AXX17_AT4G14990 [Arabidopsis thaliana]